MGRRAFAWASAAALVAMVVGFGSSAGADPVGNGVGLANFQAIHYQSGIDNNGFVTIDGVYLQGRLTLGSSTYQGQFHIGRLHGYTYFCNSPYNCSSFEGNAYSITTAGTGLFGKKGTDRVDGSCHGGYWAEGGVYGATLTTHCTAAFNLGPTYAFDIEIEYSGGAGKVNGYYCVDAPVSCGFTVSVDNPGIFGPP